MEVLKLPPFLGSRSCCLCPLDTRTIPFRLRTHLCPSAAPFLPRMPLISPSRSLLNTFLRATSPQTGDHYLLVAASCGNKWRRSLLHILERANDQEASHSLGRDRSSLTSRSLERRLESCYGGRMPSWPIDIDHTVSSSSLSSSSPPILTNLTRLLLVFGPGFGLLDAAAENETWVCVWNSKPL